jgi:probable rRNA maturation factor
VSEARLGRVARSALSSLGRKEQDLHVTVVGDREIRRLHERYLDVRRATDVLAFGLEGPGPSRLLGEVIISADTAARQASRLGVTLALEQDLLLVHGLLHLVDPTWIRNSPRAKRDPADRVAASPRRLRAEQIVQPGSPVPFRRGRQPASPAGAHSSEVARHRGSGSRGGSPPVAGRAPRRNLAR